MNLFTLSSEKDKDKKESDLDYKQEDSHLETKKVMKMKNEAVNENKDLIALPS